MGTAADIKKYALYLNMLLIGAMFVLTGYTKLFVVGPTGVSGYFSQLGIPIAGFFAWIVLLSELIGGLFLIFNFKVKYAVIPLIIILVVAAFLASWGNWPSFLMHFIIASNLAYLGIRELEMRHGKMT